MQRNTFLMGLGAALAIFFVSGIVLADKAEEINGKKRVVMKIENLSCGACFTNINNSLQPLKGFSGMGANLWRKLVAVDFSAPLTSEKIAQTITEIGYPATIESVEDIKEKASFVYQRSLQKGKGTGGGCCSGGGYPKSSGQDNNSTSKLPYGQGGSCGACPVASSPQTDL
ncbi:MAG: heavy-metal-associated domain-containing protein [Desulfobacteraceae bacterium]|nr:heavy-metal-associated domain-containing protein [Desulfobacteraceae bacterium]